MKIFIFFLSLMASVALANSQATTTNSSALYDKFPAIIIPHKPNYILGYSYTATPNRAVYRTNDPTRADFKKAEIKFQFSFKIPLWNNMFGSDHGIYFGYTQLAHWQLYYPSPFFRETNYEPEIFFSAKPKLSLFGVDLDTINLGVVHQSNGRGSDMQRGWDRVYLEAKISRGNFMLAVKPWYVFSHNPRYTPGIKDFMGHSELLLAYKFKNHVISALTRNNIESGFKRGYVNTSWSFPLLNSVNGYIQYSNGYGQSLIDYNHSSHSFGIGVSISDWL